MRRGAIGAALLTLSAAALPGASWIRVGSLPAPTGPAAAATFSPPIGLPFNTPAAVLSAMDLPHAGPLHGIPADYSWAGHPTVQDATDAQGMSAVTGWGQIYADANTTEPASGVRVEIENMQTFLWSISQRRWIMVQASPTIDGAHYVEDFSNNASVGADVQPEADGGVSVSMVPGYNFHFWPSTGRGSVPVGDVGAEFSTYQARLIGPNAASARYLANAGADWWLNHSVGYGDGTNNSGVGEGRFVYLGTGWTRVNFWTGGAFAGGVPGAWSDANLVANPPPGTLPSPFTGSGLP